MAQEQQNRKQVLGDGWHRVRNRCRLVSSTSSERGATHLQGMRTLQHMLQIQSSLSFCVVTRISMTGWTPILAAKSVFPHYSAQQPDLIDLIKVPEEAVSAVSAGGWLVCTLGLLFSNFSLLFDFGSTKLNLTTC